MCSQGTKIPLVPCRTSALERITRGVHVFAGQVKIVFKSLVLQNKCNIKICLSPGTANKNQLIKLFSTFKEATKTLIQSYSLCAFQRHFSFLASEQPDCNIPIINLTSSYHFLIVPDKLHFRRHQPVICSGFLCCQAKVALFFLYNTN